MPERWVQRGELGWMPLRDRARSAGEAGFPLLAELYSCAARAGRTGRRARRPRRRRRSAARRSSRCSNPSTSWPETGLHVASRCNSMDPVSVEPELQLASGTAVSRQLRSWCQQGAGGGAQVFEQVLSDAWHLHACPGCQTKCGAVASSLRHLLHVACLLVACRPLAVSHRHLKRRPKLLSSGVACQTERAARSSERSGVLANPASGCESRGGQRF